jgi:chloride channel protein, CIC family
MTKKPTTGANAPADEMLESALPKAVVGSGLSPTGTELFPGTFEPAQFRIVLVSFLAAAIGLISGIIAYILYKLIGLFTNLAFFHRWSTSFISVGGQHLGAWVIGIPVIGGLIVGVMAKYGTPKIKGHGIPEAMEAVLTNRSRIQPRVALLKPISAAIAIGTGGPFGAEGPIIQTGGAIGSLVGQVIHTTAVERKVLLACGAAAGMSATFNTPIAGVIIAIELLLFEFKSRSFIPLVIASTLATEVHMQLLGPGPMFPVAAMNFGVPRALPFYLVLGVVCGVAAVALTKALYWVEDTFEKLPIDELWWPAIGALLLGIIGYFVPRVFGVGYDSIGEVLNGQLVWSVLLMVMVAKFAALVISLGSGTSGGLLAPTFLWSSAMGGLFAMIGNRLFPAAHLSPGAFALVAMGAVFGAASRATFSFIIFAFEITRDYNSVLPLMLVAVIADGIAMLLMPHSSIMTEKLVRRGLRVHQDYEADALSQSTVAETMDKEVPVVPSSTRVGEIAERIARHDPTLGRHGAWVILDDNGGLAGIITRGDIVRALDKDPSGAMTVQATGSTHLVVTYPDELVSEAAAKLLRYNFGRLPVVDRADSKKVLGYLNRASILAARKRRFRDEHMLEPGWLNGLSGAARNGKKV